MATYAFYLADFPDGGTGTAVLHTTERLVKDHNRVIVYTQRHHANNYPTDCNHNINVVVVPSNDACTPENVSFLCEHIKSNNVCAMVVVAMRSFPFALIKKNTSCKMIYALHGQPFYEEHDVTLAKQLKAKRNFGRWLDYWLIQYWRIRFFQSSRKKVLPFYRDTIRDCDKFVVLCDNYVDIIVKELKLSDNDARKICSIPNGIITKESPALNKEKIILFVGRLTFEDKRPLRLLKVWSKIYKKLPDWRFIIVGDGPEKSTLHNAILQQKIERMELVGYTNNVVDFYQKASIVCLVSQYEGWGLCLAGAQAYGVIPIAFDCSAGIRDIISHPDSDGVLVAPYDCDVYAEKLLQLAPNELTLSKMRQNVIKKSKEYTIERNSEGYRKLLEEIIY